VQTVLRERMADVKTECDDMGAGEVQLARENGYESGMRVAACNKSKRWGKGELSLYKVILGGQRTYVVSRSWSGPPFEKTQSPVSSEKLVEWLAFMARVVVCDASDTSHPCPSTD